MVDILWTANELTVINLTCSPLHLVQRRVSFREFFEVTFQYILHSVINVLDSTRKNDRDNGRAGVREGSCYLEECQVKVAAF